MLEPQHIQALKYSLDNLIRRSPTTARILEVASQEGFRLYLVGGFIRDALLGLSSNDLDFVTLQAFEFATSLGKSGIRPVQVDKRYGTMRLIPETGSQRQAEAIKVELTPLRGACIEDDLRRRDFTTNALAVDLLAWRTCSRLELVDPLGGLADLQARRLRTCTGRSLADDPLRILCAYRLASIRNFTLESSTKALLAELKHRLAHVAVERLRDELLRILSDRFSARTVRMLDADNVLLVLLPECEPMRGLRQGDFHDQDVWGHSLSALEALEFFLDSPKQVLGSYAGEAPGVLAQEIAGERTRESVLKLAVLIHDIGKPACRSVDGKGGCHFHGHEVAGAQLAAALCSRLRFSNREIDFISTLVRNHMRPVHLFHLQSPSRRALSRFFRLGPELFWPLLLLFAADYRATRGPRSPGGDIEPLRRRLSGWLEFYYQELRPKQTQRSLVNGHDLMSHLHLSPGPLLGRLLDALAELQWEGRINSREEALRQATRLLHQWRRGS
ncbi:MAG: CCA tRNA nucleotidyltransferase [Syntrophobacteria bacterium]